MTPQLWTKGRAGKTSELHHHKNAALHCQRDNSRLFPSFPTAYLFAGFWMWWAVVPFSSPPPKPSLTLQDDLIQTSQGPGRVSPSSVPSLGWAQGVDHTTIGDRTGHFLAAVAKEPHWATEISLTFLIPRPALTNTVLSSMIYNSWSGKYSVISVKPLTNCDTSALRQERHQSHTVCIESTDGSSTFSSWGFRIASLFLKPGPGL